MAYPLVNVTNTCLPVDFEIPENQFAQPVRLYAPERGGPSEI